MKKEAIVILMDEIMKDEPNCGEVSPVQGGKKGGSHSCDEYVIRSIKIRSIFSLLLSGEYLIFSGIKVSHAMTFDGQYHSVDGIANGSLAYSQKTIAWMLFSSDKPFDNPISQ
jgi:hypothetical protein